MNISCSVTNFHYSTMLWLCYGKEIVTQLAVLYWVLVNIQAGLGLNSKKLTTLLRTYRVQ